MEAESRAFLSGFFDVVPRSHLSPFTESELDYLICRIQRLDLDDWKAHTVYKGEFSRKHRVVRWFWDFMDSLSQAELRKILVFATGMPWVPVEGFRGLHSTRNKRCKFQLQSIPYKSA